MVDKPKPRPEPRPTPEMAQFWYTLIEQGLEAECVAFLEALGVLNNKHPLFFVVEALHGYVEYLSQEPYEDKGDIIYN